MSLSVGARVGPYEILAFLGGGGMGEVYRARDTRLGRLVAVKILAASRGSAASLSRFHREAQAVARLNHANICTIHDVGEQDGTAFLVMELLEGETLAERLDHGTLPFDQALTIGSQIADALDAAHGRGVVHRDLKPGNVFLTASGVKLVDFGLAKLREGDADEAVRTTTESLHLTGHDSLLGTLPYMAPEQIEQQEVDARTDVFAFGVVLFEMLTGTRPFEGGSRVSLMAAIVTADPRPLAELRPGAPRSLERAISRCLAKHPDDRWQTVRDLAAELRWIAQDDSAAGIAHHGRPGYGLKLWLGIGLAAVAVAGVALASAIGSRAEPAPGYQQVTYRRGVVTSARFGADGQTFVYTASWDGQPYGVFLGRPESPDARDLGLASGRLLSISQAGDMAVLFGPQNLARAFGVRTLARIPVAGGARRDLLTGVVDADWIPGGESFAVIRDPGSNRPWTIEFPAGTKVHEARAAWSLRVSPDGNRIAFFEGPLLFDSSPEAMVTVIDRAGRRNTLSKGWSGLGLAWAPSGNEVWFTATRGGVDQPASEQDRSGPRLNAVTLTGIERIIHATPDWLVLHDIGRDGRALLSRNTIRISLACQPRGETRERDLSWLTASYPRSLSADGRFVIFADPFSGRMPSGNPTVFQRSLDGSAAVALGEGRPIDLSPDGAWVLTGLDAGHALLPTAAGAVTRLPQGNLMRVGGGAWFSDSKRIVFTGSLADNRQGVYLQEVPNGLPVAITPEGFVAAPLATVRDDRTILVRSRTGWSLFPVDGGEAESLPALAPTDFPIEWSDDGRHLYVVEALPDLRPAGFTVFRVDPFEGRRIEWKRIAPLDTVGVETEPANLRMLPDGSAYCYSYMRRLGDLFLVDGLK